MTSVILPWTIEPIKMVSSLNHFALRKAKIVCNFGLSECNRVNRKSAASVAVLPI